MRGKIETKSLITSLVILEDSVFNLSVNFGI